jgi:hypothetical protein
MSLLPAVESLVPIAAPIVDSALGRLWLPVVMAIIEHESKGVIGAPAGKETAHAGIYTKRDKTTIRVKIAGGLMQTIPNVVFDFAKAKSRTIYFEDIFGSSIDDAKKQIEIGVWLLKRQINNVSKYMKITADHGSRINENALRFIISCYAVGGPATTALLDDLKANGYPLTIDSAKENYPNFGGNNNNPYGFGEWIVKKIKSLSGVIGTVLQNTTSDYGFLLVAIGLTIYLFCR